MRIPPVGTPVIYYPNAECDNPPVGALIGAINKTGVANLHLFYGNGGTNFKQSVHHVSSKFLRDEHGKLTPGAMRMGAWDYSTWQAFESPEFLPAEPKAVLGDIDSLEVDGEDDEMNSAPPGPQAKKQLTPSQREAKCMEYIRQGLSFGDVCKRVRFLGVTRSEVQVMFEKEGKLPDANLMAAVSGAVV